MSVRLARRVAKGGLAAGLGLLLVCCPVPSQAQTDHAVETVRFLRQAWQTVRREGPRRLDLMRCQWPTEIRNVRRQATDLRERIVGKMDEAGLREKLSVLAELWRVRSSLNLLALTSPETLKAVTGMDPKQLADLKRTVDELQKRVHVG